MLNVQKMAEDLLYEEVKRESVEKINESSQKQNDFKDEQIINNDSGISEGIIDNVNKYFLIKILSPELEANEDKKRKHKDSLVNIVRNFLYIHFVVLALLLFLIIGFIFYFHYTNNDLDISYINTIIKFVTVYIASVIAEVIAMLKYIVSNVFDTSISGLVELYKDSDTK